MTFWVWAATYEEALLFATVSDIPGYRFETREQAEEKTKFWLGKLSYHSEPSKRKLWTVTVMQYV
jgi:hypothetical protein